MPLPERILTCLALAESISHTEISWIWSIYLGSSGKYPLECQKMFCVEDTSLFLLWKQNKAAARQTIVFCSGRKSNWYATPTICMEIKMILYLYYLYSVMAIIKTLDLYDL